MRILIVLLVLLCSATGSKGMGLICDDKNVQDARIYLTYMTKITLTNGLALLGIEVPDQM